MYELAARKPEWAGGQTEVAMVLIPIFPCPQCMHLNVVDTDAVQAFKLLIEDLLPVCKHCSGRLDSGCYKVDESNPYYDRAKGELVALHGRR